MQNGKMESSNVIKTHWVWVNALNLKRMKNLLSLCSSVRVQTHDYASEKCVFQAQSMNAVMHSHMDSFTFNEL